MRRGLRSAVLVAGGLVSMPAWGGAKWTQPTPGELKMTADPAAPGAPAVYLFLEETADDGSHERTFYARIKILSDEGRKYGDVVMPYWAHEEGVRGVEGRTIHSDGTVVPFSGKPWKREMVKGGGIRIMEKGFSLPDVQIGSIVEYRFTTTYQGWDAPQWYLQQAIFVHEAHYRFNPGPGGQVAVTRFLPPNSQVDEKKGFDLRIANVAPQADEEDSPPMHSLGYRVLFYYMAHTYSTYDEFWKEQGSFWSTGVDLFSASDKFKPIVTQIVAPGDTDEQKLRKIYAAVQKLQNTDFMRERTEAEEKADKSRVNDAFDVWQQRRGNRQEIALVFIGLARAAGVTVYGMRVTNRDENAFAKTQTDWQQLDDTIAIAKLDGKEVYLDPGDPYCTFGQLHWKHSWTMGIRQIDKGGTEIAQTPYPSLSDTALKRTADLRLDPDGQVHGTIRVVMTGSEALRWRQDALMTDAGATKKELHDTMALPLPSTLNLQLTSLSPLDDGEVPLTATFDVTGSLGTRTGKRLFLPASFFEAEAKPRFASETRQNPVYLYFVYTVDDDVTLTLPPAATLESVPKDGAVTYSANLNFDGSYQSKQNVYHAIRREKVGQILYQKKDYPNLRDFFQRVNAQDQQQLVAITAPAAPASAAAANQ
ncbi:MAG TPA: DUF3857 and transglutaminase domain-containing protein [Acidobacteriaceae bacterium]|nr:DUF3857 and transglutaminase domain-containing protein [Acidobacteriaceae bacterium]